MRVPSAPFLYLFLLSTCFSTLVISHKDCATIKKLSNSKLICYYSTVDQIDGCYCTHVILPSDADVKSIELVRGRAKGVKVYVSVNEFNQGLINLLKSSNVDGLEIDLKKLDSKNDISDFISTVKSKIGSNLDIAVSVPSKSDLVAKYFDFKALSKFTDLFILQTAFLGASTNVTFHPSRLSGMWDMQNTDSVVDLISGLGAPLSKLVIAAPVQAFQFTLQNEDYTAPGSPALEVQSITRDELCKAMHGGKNWTLERDEDQAGPYIFRKNQWISFEDLKSIDIKAKYSRVRGLAGIALKDLAQDGGAKCETTILEATYSGLSRQARAPRGAVLHSLEREIVEGPTKSLDYVKLSPFKISRIIDTEGKIHITRQDSRTEFKCSRQGYFVHPRSCNRFYRCVKFDQRSDDFNVFEFDCPAGLAFDERVEVCVWPGSLPHGTPCSGSSEIAPVPRKRFECPSEPGYYADPENCRWFFACLDHGKSPLEAYEFRCPFGLGFDGERLMCEWPWLVPKCGNGLGIGLESEYYYGGAGYSGKGTLSSGLVLQNYNGLGALGTIKLGGISGQLEKPIATVYSNVDSGALGLGYQNNGGYIEGGGLSYKAAQSLANAGLLRVNNGAGYQVIGQNQLGSIYTTSDLGSGNANIQYSNTYDGYGQNANIGYAAGSGYLGGQGPAISSQSYTQYTDKNGVSSGAFVTNADGGYTSGSNLYATGQGSGNLLYQGDSNVHLSQGSLGDVRYATKSAGYQDAYSQLTGYGQQDGSYAYQPGNIGIQNGAENNGYETTRDTNQGTGYANFAVTNIGNNNGGYIATSNGQENNAYINSGSYIFGKTDVSPQYVNKNVEYHGSYPGNADGAVSTQSFTQYHDQQDSKVNGNYNSRLSGNINIIGGGYSAVGTLSGVQAASNGDVDDVKTVSYSSTLSPISVTTYSPYPSVSTGTQVPTITAVPVPGIKTAAGFETFKGGVIANIPELQYKVKSHGDAGFLANISSSFANFVVTTPSTITKEIIQQPYAQNGGYAYEKPERVFEEGSLSISTARPFVTVSTEAPKVYVSSTVHPNVVQQGYVYQKPSVVFQENPVVYSTPKPVVSIGSYQKYDTNGGYKYQRPLVAFEEKPQNVVVDSYSSISTPKPVYVSQQPQVYVSSTPSPPAVSSYSVAHEVNQIGGYYYNKPAVAFEEGPTNPTVISKLTIRKPSVQQTVNTGYYYEKPTIKFEESPIVVQQPAVINEIPTLQLQQKNVVENYSYQHPVQPAAVSQYYYQQPVVKQSIVPLYKQPERLATYTYQPPVPKTIYKQPVSTYTYQNVAQASLGLSNAKAEVTLLPKPVQTYAYQPGSNYQYIQIDNNVQQKPIAVQTQGYQYLKPSIAFEEKPQVVSIVQGGTSQKGYSYEKPAVTFEETPVTYSTPKPIIAVQPAEINSYFNIGSSNSAHAVVDQEDVGYSYPQPGLKFEEAPSVTYSTPKPFVTVQQPVKPVTVTSYVNIPNSTPNPNVLVHHPVIYSTPKPFVVQPVEQQRIGYTYPKPQIKFEEKPVQITQPNILVQPINYTPKSQVIVEHKPAIVTSYFRQQQSSPAISKGYDYPKPAVSFVEEPQPVVNIYENQRPIQEIPFVKKSAYVTGQYQHNAQENYNYQQSLQGNYLHTGRAEVENYAHPSYGTVYQQQPQVVLNYVQSTPKPSFVSTIKSVITEKLQPVSPATVTFYDSRYTATPKTYISPTVAPEIKLVSTTSRPISKYSFSSLDDQYQYNQNQYNHNIGLVKSTTPELISYDYLPTTPQPNIIVEEQPIIYTPKPKVIINQGPVVVNSYFHQQPNRPVVAKGYDYPKPAVQFVEEPQPVITSYENREPVQEIPFIKKTAYVTGGYEQNAQENYQQKYEGSYQKTGKVVVENYVHPNYENVRQKVYEQPQVVLNYVSTPKPSFISTVETIATKKLQPVTPATVTFYDSRYTSTPESYVSTTVAPQINFVSTTSRPISRYSFSSLDDQYQYNQYVDIVKSTTPVPVKTYLPVTTRVKVTTALPIVDEFVAPEVTTLSRDYLPVRIRTKAPAREYLPVEVTTPAREYLPSRQRIAVTTTAPEITTLFREYLPVKSRVRVTTTGASSAAIRVVRPTTVIKQNDAHPLLSAKLGAQCTCVSNNLRLRKKQKIIVVDDNQNYDNDDDDGYTIDDGNQGSFIENYNYEPQRVVDITPTPEKYPHSTSETPQVYIQKRVKIRPVLKQTYLPVTEIADVLYKKDYSRDNASPSDKEIVSAVRTGLKLVKQAAKEGAREGTLDALSGQHFDRYGPGGVRSRSETLQGTIDCQRAGLFRHPSECNKFYACRWDCTKNRFTLHVFNCPVHLTFDNTLGACNWPSQGPACVENTLITSD